MRSIGIASCSRMARRGQIAPPVNLKLYFKCDRPENSSTGPHPYSSHLIHRFRLLRSNDPPSPWTTILRPPEYLKQRLNFGWSLSSHYLHQSVVLAVAGLVCDSSSSPRRDTCSRKSAPYRSASSSDW